MKHPLHPLLPLLLMLAAMATGFAQNAAEEGIDFNKARELLQRERSGGTLSADETAYLDRAKARRQRQAGGEKKPARNDGQRPAPARLIPLTDLGAEDRYGDQDGGLYGGGRNTPPDDLQKAALTALAKVTPRDAGGAPADGGKIAFISISMSNATMEFSSFKQLADRSDKKSPETIVVDCAQGGQAMAEWVRPDAPPWKVAMQRIKAAGVSPNQVQVVWVKLANKSPGGSLEEHGRKLESDTLKVLQNAKAMFPNLRIAYLGSRIWAGNARSTLNPEPYAYESAFVVRWLIQRQMDGDPELAPERVPLLLWGPYLWAEGEKGRKSDGLVWKPEDFAGDGVHPSTSGRRKVADLLLDFVSTDPLARGWFTGKDGVRE